MERRGIVRPARRPAGWVAPGPRPAGAGTRADLWPAAGEDLCYLTGEFRIFQRLDGHRWSLDDLVTAAVAVRAAGDAPPARALDLGCGIGSVLMMVAWAFPEARCLGLEAQELSVGLARRSLTWNGIEGRVEVRLADFRAEAAIADDEGPFDLVTGTPPYISPGAGSLPEGPQKVPCRFELRGGVEAYAAAAVKVLAPAGRFVVCEGAGQERRVEEALEAAGLGLLERVDVVPRAGKGTLFSVYLAARSGQMAPTGSALVVRDEGGQRTAEMRALRQMMGLPP